jgi:tetratricopeptide (TPR) repeat protein
MKLAEFLSFRKILPGAFVFLFMGGMAPLLPLAAPQSNSQDLLSKTKGIAETQHEIVMLLLKQKEYDKAAIEANKIFDMPWPESQEPLLLKELLILSEHSLRLGQPSLGLQIIERNFKRFKKASSQAEILKEQGYIYKSLHQNEKALECFRKAQALEHKN